MEVAAVTKGAVGPRTSGNRVGRFHPRGVLRLGQPDAQELEVTATGKA